MFLRMTLTRVRMVYLNLGQGKDHVFEDDIDQGKDCLPGWARERTMYLDNE